MLRRLSRSSFASLAQMDISQHLATMLQEPPIVEDLYLCELSTAQGEVERDIRYIYEQLTDNSSPLSVEEHLRYIERYTLGPLPAPYYMLDLSHSWMVYWLANAHSILSGQPPVDNMKRAISQKLEALLIDDGAGGFAGGPNDAIGHVASTYAAVLALCLVEDWDLLRRIRKNLYTWFLSLKHENGAFLMHQGGEHDTRSTYCVVVVLALLNLETDELFLQTRQWITSCQTYEGGFAGVPGAEAHGGYTFCAVGALFLLRSVSEAGPELNSLDLVDMDLLVLWLCARQKHMEGGFLGRTNKLVDACYSFWVGGTLALVEAYTGQELFDRTLLRMYTLNCSQAPGGGLRDKPGKLPDFYHTNYSLCGLSVAEYRYSAKSLDGFGFVAEEVLPGSAYTVPVNPAVGLPLGYAERCRQALQ